MIESLPVTPDQVDSQTQLPLRFQNCLRIELAQQEIQPRKIGYICLGSIHASEHRTANIFGIGILGVTEQVELWRTMEFERLRRLHFSIVHPHQRYVNSVCRSATHHTRNDHSCSFRLIVSRRTCSLNPQSWRDSRSSLGVDGGRASAPGALHRTETSSFLFCVCTRLADSARRCANLRSRSAS